MIDANGGGNVPEPGTLGLLLIAVVGALRARAHRSLH
ncbi:MAG: PEP-CTERM sorting domain-containing protein [Rubrivivax sp.]|nr:PEP-CTERM sorting domain-containing protein [Rubrivivax sp.]MBK8525701.1 PEP-CTERM sorting domain-containing protein [Rubrivivax sp.]